MERTTTKRTTAELCNAAGEKTDFLLRWGNRKRLRCVKTQANEGHFRKSKTPANAITRAEKKTHPLRRASSPNVHRSTGYNTRNAEASVGGRIQQQEGAKAEKGGGKAVENGEGGGSSSSGGGEAAAWPRFVVALSTREKEEDYLLFKGSKLPQRPKKRPKCVQRVLNQVSPGTWLSDVSLDRYEVREKKISKKAQKTRGLKAMEGTMSESE
ncbi:uncharacterized protein LOC144703632 isoform X2 [Wolffia australiana]